MRRILHGLALCTALWATGCATVSAGDCWSQDGHGAPQLVLRGSDGTTRHRFRCAAGGSVDYVYDANRQMIDVMEVK